MNKKKWISLIFAAILAFGGVATACDDNDGGAESSVESSSECSSSSVESSVESSAESSSLTEQAHTWGDWYAVVGATCYESGEDERVCEVCGEYETRVANALGHTSKGTVYYVRGAHWEECIRCGIKINDGAHTVENGECTLCDFTADPNVYWNDSDDVEKLRLSVVEASAETVVGSVAYEAKTPTGYDGDAQALYKIAVDKAGGQWSVSALPGMEKSVYGQFQGQGYVLTSQIYFEIPDLPTATSPTVTLASTMFKKTEGDQEPEEGQTAVYVRAFACAGWHTLEFDLDALLTHWDTIIGTDDAAHRANGMIVARGYLTDTSTRVDMFWGDFKLVDAQGNEIPLTSLS
ncbi:MAG: hypothetical protein IJV85_00300 [Clostridia bacterium]|nr:hypothetical protein [Clostridia bacterium]